LVFPDLFFPKFPEILLANSNLSFFHIWTLPSKKYVLGDIFCNFFKVLKKIGFVFSLKKKKAKTDFAICLFQN